MTFDKHDRLTVEMLKTISAKFKAMQAPQSLAIGRTVLMDNRPVLTVDMKEQRFYLIGWDKYAELERQANMDATPSRAALTSTVRPFAGIPIYDIDADQGAHIMFEEAVRTGLGKRTAVCSLQGMLDEIFD